MRLLSLYTVVLLAGCSAFGLGDVVFQTTAPTYQPGNTVTVRLANESGDGVGYNLCFSTLQRSEEGRWPPVDRSDTGDPVFCPAILLGLGSGESAESTVTIPAEAEAGTYRVETSVEINGNRHRIVTNTFRVS